ncbi:MAG: thiol-disulfide isomerase/thioredoxin [Planctomycetota bacterium]|jgi:thiol-disulfide isomerase/thioredoxin
MMETEGTFADIWAQFAENLKLGWSWSGFERSVMFLNDGNANFTNIANVVGLDQVSDGRAMTAVDIDNDGDLDLVGTSSRTAPHLYVLRNDFKTDRHHVFVELVPKGNLSPAGSKLLLTAGNWTQRRDVVIGSGYRTQHTLVQHFGLRDHEDIEQLEVTWPNGRVEIFKGLPVDTRIRIEEGTGTYRELAHKEANFNATGRLADTNWHKFWDKLQLLSAPHIKLDYQGQQALNTNELIDFATGWDNYAQDSTVTVVNLWATWCTNCRREMPDLVRADKDTENNIRVIGVCMDEGKTPEEILKAMDNWNMEFPTVFFQGEQREAFLETIAPLLSVQGGLALPTSLVIDADGYCRAISQGNIDIENLELFIKHAPFEKLPGK